jgi:hypothetical protein
MSGPALHKVPFSPVPAQFGDLAMITGELKSKVDRVWDAFWSGGTYSCTVWKPDIRYRDSLSEGRGRLMRGLSRPRPGRAAAGGAEGWGTWGRGGG